MSRQLLHAPMNRRVITGSNEPSILYCILYVFKKTNVPYTCVYFMHVTFKQYARIFRSYNLSIFNSLFSLINLTVLRFFDKGLYFFNSFMENYSFYGSRVMPLLFIEKLRFIFLFIDCILLHHQFI